MLGLSSNNGGQSTVADLDSTLTSLCKHAESLAPSSIAGLTICNPARTHIERAIFPSRPAFAEAIKAISVAPPAFGSCVQALVSGNIITCSDIEREKRFDPRWRDHCLAHGIRSLQSRPIFLRDGKPFATFVLAYCEPRPESDWSAALMAFAADAAGLAIQAEFDRASLAAE